MTPEREVGTELTIAMGAGNGLGKERAWFVSSKFGFALAPREKEFGLVLQASADYVSEVGAAERGKGPAWRAGLRYGARPVFGEEADGEKVTYLSAGAAVAVFPWSWAGSRGGSYQENEKMGDLFGSLDDQHGFLNVGFELAGERMFAKDADDAWLISLALVVEATFLPD
jgi:hypothetical protein